VKKAVVTSFSYRGVQCVYIPLTREKILGLVGKTIFDRGVQYAQSGRVVDLLVESSGEISALVEGNDTYEVTISEENQQLKFHCDCP
jgi:uncharacterized Zn finger protein